MPWSTLRRLRMLVIIASAAPAAQAADWQRLASPHFEMITDAEARDAAKVLDRLEAVRHVFLESIGGKAPAVPVRVFLFASERTFRKFEPRRAVRGFHQGGPDRDYIVLYGATEDTLRAARHEYIHVLLNHTSATLPMWLEEGTAELYSTVELNRAGALVGLPVIEHARALARLEWIPAQPFAAATRDAALLNNSGHAGLFYAQAWALVHMLNFSPAWRTRLPRFVEMIDQGTPAGLAFEPAFGAPIERALAEAKVYVRQGRFPSLPLAVPARPENPVLSSEPLDTARAALAQSELLLALGRSEAAASLLAPLAANPSASPAEVETALGLRALAARDTPSAKAHFLAAIEKKSRSAVPYFEIAMLLRDQQAASSEVRRYLSEAVGRDPNLAEAHFILGLMAQKEGRHREALESLEEATRVLPRQSYFWHARAISHHELRQIELARRAALRAAAAAATGAQLDMAQAVLKMVGASEGPLTVVTRPTQPDVRIPDSWNPKQGDSQVEGTLEHVECHGSSAVFQIRPRAALPVRIWVEKPGEILLQDASSLTFTFSCGAQQPRQVLVEYQVKSGLPRSSQGLMTAIRFRK